MSKNTWMLIGISFLVIIALYIALPIDHPDWLERGVSGNSEMPRRTARHQARS